jgi:protocatechuate 3,4-dioxygenase alpha subunit
MKLTPTGNQTVGPYFHIGLGRMLIPIVAGDKLEGTHVTIEGRVLDADKKPIPDALIETWQANAFGKYAHPVDTQTKPLQGDFIGFGRVPTDDAGFFRLATIKPGRVPGPEGVLQAPHLAVSIFMRGLLRHLVTRMYFPDEASNAEDRVLNSVDPAHRATLIAKPDSRGEGLLEWNVVCAGENETVFFDY